MNRPSFDEYFMKMAILATERSSCERRKVGAVIVDTDNHIIATGYNGVPKGLPHCIELGGCLRERLQVPSGQRHELCRGAHAENNAIIQCAISGNSTKGATIYITDSPCSMCLKSIINAGIVRIVALKSYPDELSKEFIAQCKNIKFGIMPLKED